MKILYFSQYYLNKGGAEKNLLQLVKGLQHKYGLFLAGPMSNIFFNEIKKFKIKVYRISQFSKFNIFFSSRLIKKILEKESIDILHTIDPRARLFAVSAIKNLKVKLVHTVHSSPLFYTSGGIKKSIYKKMEKELNKRTDKIIFVSSCIKNLYQREQILPENNWTIVYNGIDLDYSNFFLNNKESIKKNISKKYHLENDKVVTFVGRFSIQKGLIYLINSAIEIVKNFSNIKFILVGDGKEKKCILDKIRRYNLEKYFLLTGFQEQNEVYKILVSSDIFVLPSIYELFPYTTLEAMSLGVPIVATNVGGNNEIIQENTNGFLVPPKDGNALSLAILKILKDKKLAEKFSQNNLRDIQNFGVEKMVAQTEKVYKEILK